MTRSEVIAYALTLSGASADSPFENDNETVVLRHSDSGKWFGIIMLVNGKHLLNLKCEPMNADFLRSVYTGVIPAYHMNKTHWNSVILDSDVPDEEIKRMIDDSFYLTKKQVRRKKSDRE
ncbi:MAG: MmcQ/YjbR family DNA-binding protein [Oscillospiraceae bacterium]